MREPISTVTTTRQTRGRIKWAGVAALFTVACVATTYGISNLGRLIGQARSPTPADLARREAEREWVELWSVASRVSVVIVLIALTIIVLGGAVALVQWMLREANTIRPKDGLFPLQRLPNRLPWLRWLGGDRPLRLYNPNINPAAVLEIHPDRVHYAGAEQVSPSQMQATTQGQLVQAIAAEAAGPRVQAERQGKRGEILSPLGVYERPIPDPVLLPYTASHIDRLLEAQGEVFAAQVETGSAPTI